MAPKTVELLSDAKQSELPSRPIEVIRVLTAGQSTKIPQGSTKEVSNQKYKKLGDRLENHEQLSKSILTTLQRIEGKCYEPSSL